MKDIAIFIAGMAAGIAWYRVMIVCVLGKHITNACDYCKFQILREKLKDKK